MKINRKLIDKTDFIKNTKNNSTIDTYSCDYMNDVETYSSTEVKTNKTWTDGKPIYRKVLEYSSQTGTSFSKDISSLGISELIKLNFSVEHGGSYEMQNFYMSSTDRLRIFYNGSNSTLQFRINLAENTYNIIVILEYTKTTD